jgi:limonene-1,2-epoxide hydrolase
MQANQHPNAQLLDKFYNAFARLDTDTMAECYAPDVQFNDEAFSLRGKQEVMGMWRMLCETTKAKALSDWKLVFSGVQADAKTGKVHWEADYRFSATNRLVHNAIDGVFEFNDQGLISRHRDSFNFWLWSRQALGTPGLLLGWTPFLRKKVSSTAAANLKKFLASRKA